MRFSAISLLTVLVSASSLIARPVNAPAREVTLENEGFRLQLTLEGSTVAASLLCRPFNRMLAQGAMHHEATLSNGTIHHLSEPKITREGAHLVLQGRLAGLLLRHSFHMSSNGPWMEENIVLTNDTRRRVSLSDLRIGFTRPLAAPTDRPADDLSNDRWTAVPLRHRADDPPGTVNDFTLRQLVAGDGYTLRSRGIVGFPPIRREPARSRFAEGWAWSRGSEMVGIYSFCQEHMRFSHLEVKESRLLFGGLAMVEGEPAALTRLGPGEKADLGITRYQPLRGGFEEAAYAYRDLLDSMGCRFPEGYNPPVHWEQLYDMEGAWDHRPERYTRAALARETEKALAYSCESLYLDPGWDTAFATWLWGEEWLGPFRRFVEELRGKGLAVSLHCPLATWATSPGMSMGPFDADTWPRAARRTPPGYLAEAARVPAVREGRRNLALSPGAKAGASSVFDEGRMRIHQIAHLNDGWYGNSASWIAGEMPAWAVIDLGRVHTISLVRLGNDALGQYRDRRAARLRISAASSRQSDGTPLWQPVTEREGPLLGTVELSFSPVRARWVRVEIVAAEEGLPRLDEIEIYEAEPVTPQAAAAFERRARRGTPPEGSGAVVCLGARQYLDEAERRMLRLCEEGAAFLMFDGNWYNGGCENRAHGHPVPYTWEDHIRANLDLARRVHARFPRVLIEMHDMLAGGQAARHTPVYYKHGLPGSYDENWGFELMWDPMDDLTSGRALALYDYNLGCNVPVYLHIDLRKDNRHCIVFWWYASTCRHLGIGGTHPDAETAAAQRDAMRLYRAYDRYFKRGRFHGLGPEIHLHVLPEEGGAVVNLFNLSGTEREIRGEAALAALGLPDTVSVPENQGLAVHGGVLSIRRVLPAWSAAVVPVGASARR